MWNFVIPSIDLLFMEKGVMFVVNITSICKWRPSYLSLVLHYGHTTKECVSIPCRGKLYSVLRSLQTDSGAHPASYVPFK